MASDISQRALAARHGVSVYALRQRTAKEGWSKRRAAQRLGTPAAEPDGGRGETGMTEAESRGAEAAAGGGREGAPRPEAEAGNAEVAVRLRRKLLERLERVADAMPEGPVTETKQQEDNRISLFKLRDLTAAYKDLAGELSAGRGADMEDWNPLVALLTGEAEDEEDGAEGDGIE